MKKLLQSELFIGLLLTAYLSHAKEIKMQIPDPTPTMIGPWIDVGANRDFLGRPIESAGMQYLPKPERKRKYTSGMAIEFSKFFNKVGIGLSPLQIDYLVNSYTGGWTKQLPRTVREAADIPIMGDIFLRMPQAPKRQLNSFYSDWEYLSQKKQMGTLTEKERKKYYAAYNNSGNLIWEVPGNYFLNIIEIVFSFVA